MSKNWTGNSTWTYEGCIKVKYNGLCLADVPCRTGEYDGLFTPKINLILCQYPLSNVTYKSVNLPPALNSLEDDFFLHEDEFLLSKNQSYQLYLSGGNLVIVNVNIFLIIMIIIFNFISKIINFKEL